MNPLRLQTTRKLILLSVLITALSSPVKSTPATRTAPAEVTILCYMNGDNDLALEVLHALDMMETVGSSQAVNVVALVDGHPRWLGPYDAAWSRTRLLRLEADAQIGRITSPVIEEWGEADLGDPRTLTRFLRTALERYPARRYVFYTFAHGQGIIDTRCYELPSSAKTVSLSRDDTSGAKLSVEAFRQALAQGLNGRRFDLMVLFSCLANMVELGHALSDLTRFVVSSQDEIRLVNQPPGRFQIRGLRFEEFIARLHDAPGADVRRIGQTLVDSHVNAYRREVRLGEDDGATHVCRYVGDMALVDTAAMPALVRALDGLARELIREVETPGVVPAVRAALAATPSFASFLNLEYYDLQGFILHLQEATSRSAIKDACKRVLTVLRTELLVYARRSEGCSAAGISIYLSHPLVPENIFQTHQRLYRANAFSRDTHWDEMIAAFRPHLKLAPANGSAPATP